MISFLFAFYQVLSYAACSNGVSTRLRCATELSLSASYSILDIVLSLMSGFLWLELDVWWIPLVEVLLFVSQVDREVHVKMIR